MSKFSQILIAIVVLVGMVAALVGIAMTGSGEATVHDTHIAILVSVITPIIATLLILVRQSEIIAKVDSLQNGLMDQKIKENTKEALEEHEQA